MLRLCLKIDVSRCGTRSCGFTNYIWMARYMGGEHKVILSAIRGCRRNCLRGNGLRPCWYHDEPQENPRHIPIREPAAPYIGSRREVLRFAMGGVLTREDLFRQTGFWTRVYPHNRDRYPVYRIIQRSIYIGMRDK